MEAGRRQPAEGEGVGVGHGGLVGVGGGGGDGDDGDGGLGLGRRGRRQNGRDERGCSDFTSVVAGSAGPGWPWLVRIYAWMSCSTTNKSSARTRSEESSKSTTAVTMVRRTESGERSLRHPQGGRCEKDVRHFQRRRGGLLPRGVPTKGGELGTPGSRGSVPSKYDREMGMDCTRCELS